VLTKSAKNTQKTIDVTSHLVHLSPLLQCSFMAHP
jgi:hypothetical protein